MVMVPAPKPKRRKAKLPKKKGGTVPVAKTHPGTTPAKKKTTTGTGTTPATTTTTTNTSTTGLPGSAAGQLAQDAGQLEQEQAAADAYETQQAMVTTPSTTAPANAYQDTAQDQANQALATFFGTGSGDAEQYHPGQSYAYEVAAGTGSENNPT